MQFVALIYNLENYADVDMSELMQQYREFGREAKNAGVIVTGEALQESNTARSLKVREGESIIEQGPVKDGTQQLGGYYVLECESMDSALQWAAKIPSARYGTIEVRPTINL
ncbi:YciI family protein [Alginatibacterium sediminis]|uniref:YciI family protein n=1 Tax=Alginatibacterium sediminis TaxID=2164068 RepID=A0A420E9D1_9ALTE|nr:YciI family protein [Alginatibacterium sediminis]RKF17382.1 YciI family protein [Alginatibacterium sediminis]